MTIPATLGTAHIRTTPGTGGGGSAALSLPDVEQLIWVDTGAVGIPDGSRQNPFHTLAEAVAAANALNPATTKRVLVVVLPGVYVETATSSPDAYVYLAGTHRESCIIQRAGTILNIDEAPFEAWNLTFQGNNGTDPLLDIDCAGVLGCVFHDCRILTTRDEDAVTVNTNTHAFFEDCEISSGDETVVVVEQDGPSSDMHFHDCLITGVVSIVDGDFFGCGIDLTGSIDSTSEETFLLQGSRITSTTTHCVYFSLSDGTAGSRTFLDNALLSSFVGMEDVDGSAWAGGEAPVLPVVITTRNTVMNRGFSSLIAPSALERYVGEAGDKDFHISLPAAVSSVLNDGTTIFLLVDVALSSTLTLPSHDVVVEGNGFTVTRVGNTTFNLGSSTGGVVLKNITIVGDVKMLSGATAFSLEMVGCEVTGRVYVSTGAANSKLRIDQCQITPADLATTPALIISDADPEIVIGHSYLRGSTGEGASAAIHYDTVTNDNVSVRHSTIQHGGAASNPFSRSGAQTPDYQGHHCCYSADPTAAGWLTNLVAVGQRFDTIDTDGSF